MLPHKRIVIVSGGALGDWAVNEIRADDFLIGADRGALFLVEQGYRPDVALGDFDSVSAEQAEQIRAASREFTDCDPVWKDLTDTEMAFNHALTLKPREIVMIGALGSRLDHSLANIHLLRRALAQRVACSIVDASNRIQITDSRLTVYPDRYRYVSLLPMTTEVKGITLHGFQYPLQDAALSIGQSLGISNVLLGKEGLVEISDGLLLVMQTMD